MSMRVAKYAIPIAIMLASGGCGGGGKEGSQDPGVRQPQPVDLADDEFRFSGVARGVGPGGHVTVTIGDKSFEGVTDGNEVFKVDVPLAALDEEGVVRISATGKKTRSHIELHIAVADARNLREAAGDDRILTHDEFRDLTLPEAAVGKYARMFVGNNERHVSDSRRYRELVRDQVDGADMLLSGAAVQLIDNGAASLPPGLATVWEFITDEDALTRFAREAGHHAQKTRVASAEKAEGSGLAAVAAALIEDYEPMTPEDVPESYLLTEVSRSVLDLKGGLLRFKENGSGEHVTPAGRNAMAWRINERGELVITPEPGKLMRFVTLAELLKDSERLGTLTQEFAGDIVLRRLRAGDLADVMTMEYRLRENDLIENPDGNSADWPQTGTFLKAVTAVKPSGHAAFSAEELAGATWAMPGLALGVMQATERAAQQVVPDFVHVRDDGLFSFAANGTGVILENGDTFSWSISEAGHLEMVFADDSRTEFRKMRSDGLIHDVAVLQEDPATGELFVNGGLALPADEAASFEKVTLPANLVRFGNTATRFDLQGGRAFVVEMFEDQTAKWPSANGVTINNGQDRKWYLDGSDLVFDSIIHYTTPPDLETAFDPACDPSGPDCMVLVRRELHPLRQQGARTYALETETVFWFASKESPLYGVPATVKKSIAFWEPEQAPAE